MKQQKLEGYTPKFPKKALKGAVLTAAAAVALGAASGCISTGLSLLANPTDEPSIAGGITIAEPTEEPMIEGIVAPEITPEPEELVLSGDVMYFDPEE